MRRTLCREASHLSEKILSRDDGRLSIDIHSKLFGVVLVLLANIDQDDEQSYLGIRIRKTTIVVHGLACK